MKPGELLYEGKAKRLYFTEDPNVLRVKYKDSATAFNGQKKATIAGKGEMNNRISALFFRFLKEAGVPNHFIDKISDLEQLVQKVTIVPLEVVVRNRVAGTLQKRTGLAEGTVLKQPIVEFYYKSDELGDPLFTEDHIRAMELATPVQLQEMREIGLRVNEVVGKLMLEQGIILVDFKLEFGLDSEGKLLLADEVSPDTCRFWDADTLEKLDKDRFRQDLGNVMGAYQEIYNRLEGKSHV
ncbi:phosphoribosylaminoimidazolesuccinocarboxamide synthase [Risungbinella massiliensis]|uniref:phosphoribosylaminoimidazolesuccinocarboxamide synthase n=1 Tax=Risungbinella massiliensis TaxID=1329796 RepID=UPI0005CC6388|nr:phosphoribosylaminoimidazolesuccinocarboxamide synthase [Risungbinella massiliensis]